MQRTPQTEHIILQAVTLAATIHKIKLENTYVCFKKGVPNCWNWATSVNMTHVLCQPQVSMLHFTLRKMWSKVHSACKFWPLQVILSFWGYVYMYTHIKNEIWNNLYKIIGKCWGYLCRNLCQLAIMGTRLIILSLFGSLSVPFGSGAYT